MTATVNGQEKLVSNHSYCIVSCGWLDCEGEHGDYCERAVGGQATAVPNGVGPQRRSGVP